MKIRIVLDLEGDEAGLLSAVDHHGYNLVHASHKFGSRIREEVQNYVGEVAGWHVLGSQTKVVNQWLES